VEPARRERERVWGPGRGRARSALCGGQRSSGSINFHNEGSDDKTRSPLRPRQSVTPSWHALLTVFSYPSLPNPKAACAASIERVPDCDAMGVK
jgi:hypothetical protein